jgi:hypothetical protein
MNSIKTTLPSNNIDVSNTDVSNTNIEPTINNSENILIDTIEHLYNYVKSVHTSKINPSNIIIIATEIIQIVEKYDNLTGVQKKMVVISVIKKLVNTQFDTNDDKKAMNLIIDLTLPTVIDNLISAINGDLKFNKEKVKSFFKKLWCCTK